MTAPKQGDRVRAEHPDGTVLIGEWHFLGASKNGYRGHLKTDRITYFYEINGAWTLTVLDPPAPTYTPGQHVMARVSGSPAPVELIAIECGPDPAWVPVRNPRAKSWEDIPAWRTSALTEIKPLDVCAVLAHDKSTLIPAFKEIRHLLGTSLVDTAPGVRALKAENERLQQNYREAVAAMDSSTGELNSLRHELGWILGNPGGAPTLTPEQIVQRVERLKAERDRLAREVTLYMTATHDAPVPSSMPEKAERHDWRTPKDEPLSTKTPDEATGINVGDTVEVLECPTRSHWGRTGKIVRCRKRRAPALVVFDDGVMCDAREVRKVTDGAE